MPHYRDGFYHQKDGTLEVWFYVKGVHEYKPPDRTIRLSGFYSEHVRTAQEMIDEHAQQKGKQVSLSRGKLYMGHEAQRILGKLKEYEALGEARDANAPLINVCGTLSACVSSLGEDNNQSVLWAKEACEALLGRATRAVANGATDFAEKLRGHVAELAPLVAKLYTAPRDEEPETNG